MLASIAPAQRSAIPVVRYELRIDSADRSGFDVEMRVRGVPDTFRVAMAAHPEYDDQYWRFVEGLRAETRTGSAAVSREDSALWRVVAPGGDVVVRYRIRLPAAEVPPRAAWRPFLGPTGALVGGPHSFMYVLGATRTASHVALEIPRGWEIATGLEPTAEPRIFFAPSVYTLVDSPILVGQFRTWRFAVDGVPHRVVYWPMPPVPGTPAAAFDTATFVSSIERLAQQAVALFGRAPYREYTFLFQEGAYGGLEHMNSVTLGVPGTDGANSTEILAETAHEFIHTWNLMRIRPAERGDVDYRQSGQSRGLWWSEGATMYYADLLLRRAGLPVSDSTRVAHLESLIARYQFNPGNFRVSPERASLAEYGAPPGSLGDYDPSPHLQGELLSGMLDLIVRDATNGRRSLDDVMRAMLRQSSVEQYRGFTGRDIERTVAEICRCVVRPFFDTHIRAARSLDFDSYLRLIGLRTRVSWSPALDREGRPATDLRMRAWQPPGQDGMHLLITDPASVWGRAGLHTGDRLVAMNGSPMTSWGDVRGVLSRLRIGDTVHIELARSTGPRRTSVVAAGYERPQVRIEEIPEATERQRALRAGWLAGKP
ncbi:MAG: hypothetical protein ABR543_17350 [Gemmatimonadaceae bacterium]